MKYDDYIKELTTLLQDIKLEIIKVKSENDKLKEELEMYKTMYNSLSDLVYKNESKKR